MFGLMAIRGCGLGKSARDTWRRHYCGTCKTLGREYGQASRLLLNHDTVLVAEMISAAAGEPAWEPNILSRNCLKLPRRAPVGLQFAAAATILLAGAKARDHAWDTGQWRWRAAELWLASRYRRARLRLQEWGVPVEEIERELATQKQREKSPQSLEHLAAPTCFATGAICRAAARIAGHAALEDAAGAMGERFGRLIYLVDAWQDFDKDAARGQFNAFGALYGSRERGRRDVMESAAGVMAAFGGLPLKEDFRNQLMARVRTNMNRLMPAFAIVGQHGAPQCAAQSNVLAFAGMPGPRMPGAPPSMPIGIPTPAPPPVRGPMACAKGCGLFDCFGDACAEAISEAICSGCG